MPVNEETKQLFQNRLHSLREKRGWNQTDLAQATGLMPSAISHFETGKRSPSFDNLKKLADALGTSVDYLLGRERKAGTAGPMADLLLRNFGELSADDQKMIADMADMLLKRNKKAHDLDGKK